MADAAFGKADLRSLLDLAPQHSTHFEVLLGNLLTWSTHWDNNSRKGKLLTFTVTGVLRDDFF